MEGWSESRVPTLKNFSQVTPWSIWILKAYGWDFPGGPRVKNLPASAGDMDLIPGPGRSHVPWSNQACGPQQLSLDALTPEAWAPRACALQQEKQL